MTSTPESSASSSPSPSSPARAPASSSSPAASAGVAPRRRTKSSRHRHGHRVRPGLRAADRRAAAEPTGPTTRSSARRAPTPPGTQRRALADRPDRRHDQLPLRPARLRRVDRRARPTTARWPARSTSRRTDELFTADGGGGARLNGAPIRCGTTTDAAARARRHRLQLPRRAPPATRPTRIAELIGRGPRHPPARRGGPRPVLRRRRPGRRRTSSSGSARGTVAAGELIAREAGCRTGRFDGGPVAAEPRCWRPTRRCSMQMVESAGAGTRHLGRTDVLASCEPWEPASCPSKTTSASARRSSWRSRTRAGRSTRPAAAKRPSSCSTARCPTSC